MKISQVSPYPLFQGTSRATVGSWKRKNGEGQTILPAWCIAGTTTRSLVLNPLQNPTVSSVKVGSWLDPGHVPRTQCAFNKYASAKGREGRKTWSHSTETPAPRCPLYFLVCIHQPPLFAHNAKRCLQDAGLFTVNPISQSICQPSH